VLATKPGQFTIRFSNRRICRIFSPSRAPPGQRSSLREFLCRIWYLCWNLTKVGQAEAGHGADTPMQAESSGSTDLHSLVMFVVDATKPFSSPAAFP
jgi:hypothetical protein